MRKGLVISLLMAAQVAAAQERVDTRPPSMAESLASTDFPRADTPNPRTVHFFSTVCKGYRIPGYGAEDFMETEPLPFAMAAAPVIVPVTPVRKQRLITIHGNVSYDFFYRSAMDTPVYQRNLQQHTERISLDILIKDKYPLKLAFSGRQSNSPYFSNFFDVNLLFDRFGYNRNLKQQVLDKLKAQLPSLQYPDLANYEEELRKLTREYDRLRGWLNDPATLQKLIEEKERSFSRQVSDREDSLRFRPETVALGRDEVNTVIGKMRDSLGSLQKAIAGRKNKIADTLADEKNKLTGMATAFATDVKNRVDSVLEPYQKIYDRKKQQLDSLEKRIADYKMKADSVKGRLQRKVQQLQLLVSNARNEKELGRIARENGITLPEKSKFEKQLAAIKSLNIGKSLVNYTELTAQNITLTGINVEYNPSYYVAFAAGKIDYRFRDFLNKGSRHNNQYLVMGRLGIGDKDHLALIFSYFMGRKATSQFGFTDSVKNYVSLMGYSVEALYKKDENTSISAEFAKSTKPVAGSLQNGKQTREMWNYTDRTNMGINIKGQTILPETHTRFSGFYRKTGENFQSFSLFTYNTDQTAWMARADQSFFKDRITLTAMLRRNDFTNPFTDKTYKTSTVFKTLVLNIRVPKYPSVSIGYYPGSQLYMIDRERIRESAYYILNGSVVYSYSVRRLSMNTSLVYNRYTNEATDSGFIPFKGVNCYALQTIWLRKLQLQGGYAWNQQPNLQYYTVEATADYQLRKWLRAGAGLKYNRISGGGNYWGGSAILSASLKQLGMLQFQYEKSYLTTIRQTLYPVETGRFSYYKNF